jgi:predicted RNase H-like HicB family nuclease
LHCWPIVTLGLGIGSATTIFSAIQNILLDPFPYTDAERVVAIQIRDTASSRPGGRTYYPTPEYLELEAQNHVFDEVIGGTGDDVLYNNGEGMEQFMGGYVTPNTFRFLGVPALLVRAIAPDDAKPGASPVFLMAYKLWVRRFNRDTSIIGRTFVLNGKPTVLIGIMPERFTKLGAELWMAKPVDRASPDANETYWNFQAKLKSRRAKPTSGSAVILPAIRPSGPAVGLRRPELYWRRGTLMETAALEFIPITLGREDDGRWWADIESMPGVLAYGESREQAITAVRTLALRAAADCLDHGEEVPAPLARVFSVA